MNRSFGRLNQSQVRSYVRALTETSRSCTSLVAIQIKQRHNSGSRKYSSSSNRENASKPTPTSSPGSKPAAKTPLQLLAARIAAHADALAAAASERSHPARSLSAKPATPASLLPANAPISARSEQLALRDALAEATLLATDASEFVPELAVRNNQFASVRWLCHFDIPSLLPLEDSEHEAAANDEPSIFPSLPYSKVSSLARVPEHQLRSIARMAMLAGFLSEPAPNRLSHSPLSAAMVRQPELLEWARFTTGTSAPMVGAMVEATERWGDDRSIHRTAYNAAWKTDLPLFAHVAANPELQERYARYMRVMTRSRGMALGHLLQGWREGWESLARRGGVLVDVGGSAGHASAALAREFPGIRAVVQDREEVVARAKRDDAPRLEGEGLKVVFQAHDFFEAQPERPRGFEDEGKGDVYFLRQILHDWGDDKCITILRHLAAALERAGPDARLVVMDTVLPSPGEGSRTVEALLRVRDLTMQQAHNAHERSREEWEELLAKAHRGLVIKKIVQPFDSLMAVIEITLEAR